MDKVNQTIAGRYRILRKLGEGGMGSVWLAQTLPTDKNVVIKIMHHDLDERSVKFFRQEAEVLARISNPHIGRILDFGELDDGRTYLVLEYIEGASLKQLLARGHLPVEYALVVAEAVANALSTVHSIGIIHRDLKPSNIIVPKANGAYLFGKTKVIDFGVRGEIRPSTGTTLAGELYGTPQYMSPEQIRAQEQSPATDIYGLGAVLFEMIYGKPTFVADVLFEVMSKTLTEEVTFPASPFISASVRDLIRRCLSKQAKNRPQNGSVLLDEIRRVRSAFPSTGASEDTCVFEFPFEESRHTAVIDFTLDAAKTESPMTPGEPSVSASRRIVSLQPWLLLILIATLFIGVALLTIFFGSLSPLLHRLAWVFVGMILSISGVGMWFLVRNWLGERKSEIQRDADSILLGRKSLDALTQSLAIEVDAIIARVKQVDERIIAHTLAMMVKEYEEAKESKDRQSALVNAVSILEKLNTKLSPWYVRHDKFVAFVVSSVGIVSGIVTIVTNVIKIKKGPL